MWSLEHCECYIQCALQPVSIILSLDLSLTSTLYTCIYTHTHTHTCAHMQSLQDLHLAAMVLFLLVIDVVILVIYTIVEESQGNLDAIRVPNLENTRDVEGVRVHVSLYLYKGGVVNVCVYGWGGGGGGG